MQHRTIGNSDLCVSPIGLGTSTWGTSTDMADADTQLRTYLDAGGNFVDTADVYGNGRAEEIIGDLFAAGVARESVVLATKAAGVLVGGRPAANASREHLLTALDASLRRLRTDHVDLWQLHAWDERTPIEETLAAVDDAITAGKVRQVGVCNYAGWQTATAASLLAVNGGCVLASAQAEYSLLERGIEREVVPAIAVHGFGILPWAPLGRGVLTGKYRHGVPEERAKSRHFAWYVRHHVNDRAGRIVEAVAAVADELGVPLVTVALAWVRDRPGVVAPLVGARTADQLRESLTDVADGFVLPDEHRERLDDVSTPYSGYPERSI